MAVVRRELASHVFHKNQVSAGQGSVTVVRFWAAPVSSVSKLPSGLAAEQTTSTQAGGHTVRCPAKCSGACDTKQRLRVNNQRD